MAENAAGESKLEAFLAAAKEKGASDDVLARLLQERGWPEKEILKAFGGYYERLTGQAIPARTGGLGEAAKEAFLYLLSFSTLGVWATALGGLVFRYLDRWFPDPVAAERFADPIHEISTSLASVIVAYPVYLLVMRLIMRDLAEYPEKHESGIRRWLTYIALFIAAGIVIGDLIAFLAFFLRGELTARFALKMITVLVIAGGVFWYYLGWMGEAREACDGGNE